MKSLFKSNISWFMLLYLLRMLLTNAMEGTKTKSNKLDLKIYFFSKLGRVVTGYIASFANNRIKVCVFIPQRSKGTSVSVHWTGGRVQFPPPNLPL